MVQTTGYVPKNAASPGRGDGMASRDFRSPGRGSDSILTTNRSFDHRLMSNVPSGQGAVLPTLTLDMRIPARRFEVNDFAKHVPAKRGRNLRPILIDRRRSMATGVTRRLLHEKRSAATSHMKAPGKVYFGDAICQIKQSAHALDKIKAHVGNITRPQPFMDQTALSGQGHRP